MVNVFEIKNFHRKFSTIPSNKNLQPNHLIKQFHSKT